MASIAPALYFCSFAQLRPGRKAETKMTIKGNVQTNKEQQRYVLMEVTPETIKAYGLDASKVVWAKIGIKSVRAIRVPVTEEVYLAYMRPLWRELKRMQRHTNDISLDWLYEENDFEFSDSAIDIEDSVTKRETNKELQKVLGWLEEEDRRIMIMVANGMSESAIGQVIGLSQRGVGKRKKRIFDKLREQLKDYR